MQNDWQLGGGRLLALVPWKLKLKVKFARLLSFGFGLDGTFALDVLTTELQKNPQTALQTIMDAYLKLVKDAKRKRKPGDPWPVIIIDEANALMEWKETATLNALLKFFVYLTKQEQLAHVVLATSDTFLTQWLESGVPRLQLALRLLQVFTAQPLLRSHQRPVPLLARAGQPDARGGAHVLFRLHLAVPQAPAWRRGGVGARV